MDITTYICYKITNTITNQSYVGQTTFTVEDRWNKHVLASFCSNETNKNIHLLQKAIKEYGVESFVTERLMCTTSPKEIDRIEKQMIKQHNTFYLDGNGYNMTRGGGGTIGYKFTDEVRLKMSLAQKGKKRGPRSEEVKRKISEANKGRKPSLYTLQRRKEACTGVPRSEQTKNKIKNTLTGTKRPKEVVDKIIASKRKG